MSDAYDRLDTYIREGRLIRRDFEDMPDDVDPQPKLFPTGGS
jgi:hypothetical protein